MTSLINITGINTNYPVAGVDNNSQGFRDNFAAIAAQFTEAANEITTLQSTAVVNNANNNFNGNQIQNFVSTQNAEFSYTITTPAAAGGTTQLNWNNGSYQIAVSDTATDGVRSFGFSNFGTVGSASRLTVQFGLTAPQTNPNRFAFPASVVIPTNFAPRVVVDTTTGAGFVQGPVIVDTMYSGLLTNTGAVTDIGITNGGTGYSAGDSAMVIGGNGFGANATLTVNGSGVTTGFVVANGGYGYSANVTGPVANGVHTFSFVTSNGGTTVFLENYLFTPA